MNSNCSYCRSACAETDSKCKNCGAPIEPDGAALKDFRSCPSCGRRLLALASPACNHCGRRLPPSYIKAREADLKRIIDLGEVERREALRSANGFDGMQGLSPRKSGREYDSLLDLVDITDLFSLLK